MKLAVILFLVGTTILAYASSIAPYKDERLFTERYLALSAGQSAEYWELRDEMLTPKFQLQDYGGTFVATALVTFLVSRRGWRQLKSPKSRTTLFALALAAPVLTVCAYIFDLFLGFERGKFPHWADSMGIPLMGVPFALITLLAWSAAHLAFIRRTYRPALLSLALSRKANWWLLSVASLTAVLVAWCAALAQYWYAIPGVAWLYFYASLAAARRSTHDTEPCGQPDLAQEAAQGRLP